MNPQGPGKIEWTDFTWNPVTGCLHGCDYGPDGCYAARTAKRIYKEGFTPTFRPEKINEKEFKIPAGSKVFVCNMGDLFGHWVPDEWISPVIEACRRHPELTFQFLTKNPERYREYPMPKNCWIGTTVERPESHDHRLQTLLAIHDMHTRPIKFVSFEPLFGPSSKDLNLEGVDWAIIGEVTGKRIKDQHKQDLVKWAAELITVCRRDNVAVFTKNEVIGTAFPLREFPGAQTRLQTRITW